MADTPVEPRQAAVPTPAATVIPLRDGEDGLEVLLLRRAARGAFGGMWVFPGGQVDPVDLHSTSDDRCAEEVEAGRGPQGGGARGDARRLPSSWRKATWSRCRSGSRPRRRPGASPPGSSWPRRTTILPSWSTIYEIHEHRWQTPAAAMSVAQPGARSNWSRPPSPPSGGCRGHANVAAASERRRPPAAGAVQ